MTSVAARRAPVTVRIDGATVVLEVAHRLDESTGEALVAAAASAVTTQPARVDIDLQQVDAWTEGGVESLVRCRDLCCDLPDGLHYRTGRGPGRDALLAAYT